MGNQHLRFAIAGLGLGTNISFAINEIQVFFVVPFQAQLLYLLCHTLLDGQSTGSDASLAVKPEESFSGGGFLVARFSGRLLAGCKDLAHQRRLEFVKLLPGITVWILQAQGKRAQRAFFFKVLLPERCR